MVKNFLFILIWLLSLIFISLYTYENPEKLEAVKHYFNKYKKQEIENIQKFDNLNEVFSEENTFFAAIYTQLLILTVTLVLLLVRSKGYMAPEVFEIRLAPFMVLLAAIFTIHTLRPFFEMKNILILAGLGVFFSLIYSLLSEGRGWMVGAMAPWAVICGFSIFFFPRKY